MIVRMGLLTFGLAAGSAFGAGALTGMFYCWTSWRLRWHALDRRAATLDQQAELLDMRSMAMPSAVGDSGFAKPSLPTRREANAAIGLREHDEGLFDHARNIGFNDTGKRFPASPPAPAVGDAPLEAPAPTVVAPPVAEVAEVVTLAEVMMPALDNAAWRRYAKVVALWLEGVGVWAVAGLPIPALYPLAAIMAYWPHRAEAPRPLDAPMAYVSLTPTVRATASVVSTQRTVAASSLIDRLRAERGQVGPVATPSAGGRHEVSQAPGATTQRERSQADAQRWAARAAKATAADTHPRIFDTAETVVPPWTTATAAAQIGEIS